MTHIHKEQRDKNMIVDLLVGASPVEFSKRSNWVLILSRSLGNLEGGGIWKTWKKQTYMYSVCVTILAKRFIAIKCHHANTGPKHGLWVENHIKRNSRTPILTTVYGHERALVIRIITIAWARKSLPGACIIFLPAVKVETRLNKKGTNGGLQILYELGCQWWHT